MPDLNTALDALLISSLEVRCKSLIQYNWVIMITRRSLLQEAQKFKFECVSTFVQNDDYYNNLESNSSEKYCLFI